MIVFTAVLRMENNMDNKIREMVKKADSICSETRGVFDEILVQVVAKECAKIAREHTLSKSGLDLGYDGKVFVEEEILDRMGITRK